MKQTNSAIKFLMAQYRAIFNNAYFKGLATAAVATMALAAGQAQAAGSNKLADFISGSSNTAVKGDFTSSEATETLSQTGGFLTNLTIASGTAVTFGNGSDANTDHLHVYETLTVKSGGTLTLVGKTDGAGNGWGIVGATNKAGEDLNDFKATSKLAVDGGKVEITKSQIQMASIDLNNATVTIKTNHGDSKNPIADNAQITAIGVTDENGNVIAGTGAFKVRGDKTSITLDTGSILNAGSFSFEDGKIIMKGADAASGTSAVIRTFISGGKLSGVMDFQGTDVEVSGSTSGNYIGGKEVNLKSGSTIELKDSAALHLSGVLNAANSVTDIKNVPLAGTINLDGATLKIGASGELIIDNAESVFNAKTGTITNSGAITFNNKTVNTTATLFDQMVAGKVEFKANDSVLNVSGDLNLDTNKVIKSDDGTLTTDKLVISGDKLTLNGDKVTLGTKYAADKLDIEAKDLVVGKDFAQTKQTLTVTNILTGSGKLVVGDTNANAAVILNLTDGGSVSGINAISLQGKDTNKGTLNVTGAWTGLDKASLTLESGGAAVLTDASITLKDLDVKANGALNLDNSSLTVKESVKNAQATTGVDLKNNSTLSLTYAKVTTTNDAPNKTDIAQAFTLDGTSTLVLTGRAAGEMTKAKMKALKEAFLGNSGAGLFKIEGATLSADESGIKEDGTVEFATASGNAGYADIYENVTVTGVTADALTTSNDWGAAQLNTGVNELSIGASGSVTLNGVDGKLVTDASGAAASVKVSGTGSILNIQGNGTLKAITAGADQGKVLVGAALTVSSDIGANNTELNELIIQQNGSVQAKNAYVNNLTVSEGASLTLAGAETDGALSLSGASVVNGTLSAKNITSASGDLNVGGSLVADKLEFTGTTQNMFVGNDESSGLLEVKSLVLNNGNLLLDPDYTQPTNFAAVTGEDINADEVISLGGNVGVGRNSVLAIGTSVDAAKNIVSRLGLQNGQALQEAKGAVLVIDNTLQIDSGTAVVVNSKLDHAGLSAQITSDKATSNSGSFVLAKDSVLVVTESMTQNSSNNQKPVIEFKGNPANNAKLTLEAGSTLAFDTALTAKDEVKLTNITTGITASGEVVAANGLLTGAVDSATGKVSFALKRDQAAKGLYNTSAPVKDFVLDALDGKFGKADDADAGIYYTLMNAGHDGGKAVEGTARLAVYGGVVQGTDLAQKAANDAVVERMSRSNPNGSLVFANNAQGGGLWLSPVYKSHESDSFDADGVDYGVDGDLTGLVLGADSTTDSGVRVGGYFNFGSASFDGQGVGDQVSNDADYFGFGLYAGMTSGQFSLLADAGFTQVSNDIEQSTGHKDYSKVKADVDSTAVTLGLRGEYKLNVASVDVTPHLGVRYTRLNIDGYDAKANGHTLATTDFDTMQMFSIPFGVTVSKDIAAGAWSIKPVFDLTLTANAGDTDATFNTTFIGGRSLDLTSEAFDSFTYGATVGIDAKYGENFSIGLNTNYVGSSNVDEFGVMGNVRYMF